MIDVAIKYLLADLCIDVFFTRVFNSLELDAANTKPRIGDVYSRIVHKYSDETYYNCQVVDLEPIQSIPGEYIVYVHFTSKVCTDIDEFDGVDDGRDPDISDMVKSMSDGGIREYVHAITNDVMDTMSREEMEDIIYDDELDMSDVDLVETIDDREVGLSTLFFTFYN